MNNNRNCRNDPCPGCGEYIPKCREMRFSTRRGWRIMVADRLGYDREFILRLGENTRIHAHHFNERDIKNNKPIGFFLNKLLSFSYCY